MSPKCPSNPSFSPSHSNTGMASVQICSPPHPHCSQVSLKCKLEIVTLSLNPFLAYLPILTDLFPGEIDSEKRNWAQYSKSRGKEIIDSYICLFIKVYLQNLELVLLGLSRSKQLVSLFISFIFASICYCFLDFTVSVLSLTSVSPLRMHIPRNTRHWGF